MKIIYLVIQLTTSCLVYITLYMSLGLIDYYFVGTQCIEHSPEVEPDVLQR